MWFLFHRKAKTKAVPDGELVHEHCPTCRRTTLFHEVEVTKKPVVKEEVRARKERRTETEPVSGEVRKEEVKVEPGENVQKK